MLLLLLLLPESEGLHPVEVTLGIPGGSRPGFVGSPCSTTTAAAAELIQARFFLLPRSAAGLLACSGLFKSGREKQRCIEGLLDAANMVSESQRWAGRAGVAAPAAVAAAAAAAASLCSLPSHLPPSITHAGL